MCRSHPAKALSDLLTPTPEPGIYLRSGAFQNALDELRRRFFQLLQGEEVISYHSSGFITRNDLLRSSYIDKFPQFVARVVPELGGEGPGDLVTLPSACLSIYADVAALGPIPEGGLLATVSAPCFRNEVGYGPERMRSFNMSEYVFFGDAAATQAFRETLIVRVQAWMAQLALTPRLTNASDPFFGRIGEILAERQRAASLKQELFLPIGPDTEIACFSFNDHRDFFCSRWDILDGAGQVGQSSCVGVGLERLALAMFHRHGPALDAWPAPPGRQV